MFLSKEESVGIILEHGDHDKWIYGCLIQHMFILNAYVK